MRKPMPPVSWDIRPVLIVACSSVCYTRQQGVISLILYLKFSQLRNPHLSRRQLVLCQHYKLWSSSLFSSWQKCNHKLARYSICSVRADHSSCAVSCYIRSYVLSWIISSQTFPYLFKKYCLFGYFQIQDGLVHLLWTRVLKSWTSWSTHHDPYVYSRDPFYFADIRFTHSPSADTNIKPFKCSTCHFSFKRR
jgi:hypothetical protein